MYASVNVCMSTSACVYVQEFMHSRACVFDKQTNRQAGEQSQAEADTDREPGTFC